MSITISKITDYITAPELWVGFDLPADLTGITISAAGVPTGARARNLGAIQGEVSQQYTPTIATVDIEQSFAPIAPHVTQDAMSIKATLVEPTPPNIEMVSSQGTRWNFLDNPSFEGTYVSGVAPNWGLYGTATAAASSASAQPAYGKQAQTFATAAVVGGIQTAKIFHPDLVAGKICVFSAYVKAGAATPNITVTIEAFDAAGASISSNTAVVATSTAYGRASVAFTLPSLTATVQCSISDNTGQTATWVMDNAQLEIVASGSTPTAVIGPRMLSLGGRLDTRTFPVAVIGQKPGTSKYVAFVIWNAYVTGGMNISKQKGQPTAFQCTFTGTPVPTYSAGNSYGVYQEQA